MALPPSTPAVKAILAVVLPGVAARLVGAEGVVRGVTDTLSDAAPAPAAFTARSCTVYSVPFVSPVSVAGLVAVPALWVWSLVPRPAERLGRLAWSLGPVVLTGLLIFLLRGADPATLIGAAATGALPPALVVGGSVLIGAGAVGALAED